MSIFSIERNGFVDCQVLVNQLLIDLNANGMTKKFPANALTGSDHAATFESSVDSDPLFATQPWRLRIAAIDASKIVISAAAPAQLPDDGSNSLLDDGKEYAGHLGQKLVTDEAGPTNVWFVNRANLAASERASYPMSYRLTVTPHGIALFIWEPGNDQVGNNQSWLVIQRLVNNQTGAVRVAGKSPVVCLYGIKHVNPDPLGDAVSPVVNQVNRFIVRESDIPRPTVSTNATVDGADTARVVNFSSSVAITEDNNYVISFPNSINSQRFAYPTDELDLLAYTSADVISQNSPVEITVYGETLPRIYKAMSASGANNTGMRILMLESGGNI
jgi:hypothetical protein